jgi:hypothetical protein
MTIERLLKPFYERNWYPIFGLLCFELGSFLVFRHYRLDEAAAIMLLCWILSFLSFLAAYLYVLE